jgi:hypothetical protein
MSDLALKVWPLADMPQPAEREEVEFPKDSLARRLYAELGFDSKPGGPTTAEQPELRLYARYEF